MTDYTSAEFWRGAPKTSTHYQPPRGEGFNPVFWRVENGVPVEAWAVMENGDLRHVPKPSYIDDVFGLLIARPSPPWSGDGLPPAGTVCEWTWQRGGYWVACEVVAVSRIQVVLRHADDSQYRPGQFEIFSTDPLQIKFRPIKTPAQIAAEERAAAIEAMWDIYWQPSATSAKQALGLLWDAGLRFPKGDDK